MRGMSYAVSTVDCPAATAAVTSNRSCPVETASASYPARSSSHKSENLSLSSGGDPLFAVYKVIDSSLDEAIIAMPDSDWSKRFGIIFKTKINLFLDIPNLNLNHQNHEYEGMKLSFERIQLG